MSQSPLIVKYEKALREDPRSRAFAPLAEAYRKVGLIDKAFEVLKKGIRYNPDYMMGYFSLSQCYFEKGEYALAYTTLRPISSKNRDNLKLQKLFGEVCCETQNYEEALDTFKYMLYLNPRDEETSLKVTTLENRLNESSILLNESEVSFDVDELTANPENDKALDDWIQVDMSISSEVNKLEKPQVDVIESVEDWEEAGTELKPEDAPEETHEVEDAIFTEASDEQAEPIDDTPVITHTLVDLYLNQGHTQKAIDILEKIIQIQPENKESLERLSLLKDSKLKLAEDISFDGLTEDAKDEGHSVLSAALDETLDDDSETFEKTQNVDEVLTDFLSLLRDQSVEYSQKKI